MTAEDIHDALRMVGRGLINHPKVVALAEHLATLAPAPHLEVSGAPSDGAGVMLFGVDLAAEAGQLEQTQPEEPQVDQPAQDTPTSEPEPAAEPAPATPVAKPKAARKRKGA